MHQYLLEECPRRRSYDNMPGVERSIVIKILIAEDDARILLLIRHTLEAADREFEIHEAKNGKLAITMIEEIIPDIVILDVMMPGATGYEVCEKIKKNTVTNHVKVIFLTGFGSMSTKKLARDHGGDDLIVKPFKPEDLLEKINCLLK